MLLGSASGCVVVLVDTQRIPQREDFSKMRGKLLFFSIKLESFEGDQVGDGLEGVGSASDVLLTVWSARVESCPNTVCIIGVGEEVVVVHGPLDILRLHCVQVHRRC